MLRTADTASPSTSESFASTPVARIVSDVSSFVLYESFTATGASFTGLTVIVTVAMFESAVPSFA